MNLDLLDKVCEQARMNSEALKRMVKLKQNTKLRPH